MSSPDLTDLLEAAAPADVGRLDTAELRRRVGRARRRRRLTLAGVALGAGLLLVGGGLVVVGALVPATVVELATEPTEPLRGDAGGSAVDSGDDLVDVDDLLPPIATDDPAEPDDDDPRGPEPTPAPPPSPTPSDPSAPAPPGDPPAHEPQERADAVMWLDRATLLPGEDGTAHVENTGTIDLTYGAAYTIQRWEHDRWVDADPHPPNFEWPLWAEGLGPGERMTFTFRAGTLPPGRYRVTKKFWWYTADDPYYDPARAIWPLAEFTIGIP